MAQRRSWREMDNDERVREIGRRESSGQLFDSRNGPVVSHGRPPKFEEWDDEHRYWHGLGMPDPRLSWWESELHNERVMVPRWNGRGGEREMWRVKR